MAEIYCQKQRKPQKQRTPCLFSGKSVNHDHFTLNFLDICQNTGWAGSCGPQLLHSSSAHTAEIPVAQEEQQWSAQKGCQPNPDPRPTAYPTLHSLSRGPGAGFNRKNNLKPKFKPFFKPKIKPKLHLGLGHMGIQNLGI